MSGGAIFGVIVGVLAAVALLGVAGYFGMMYARDNNLFGIGATNDSSAQPNVGFTNQNYDSKQPYGNLQDEFAPSPIDTPSNGQEPVYDNADSIQITRDSGNNGIMFVDA
jgi:hypothetical protein